MLLPSEKVGKLIQLIGCTYTGKLITFHKGGFKTESTKITYSLIKRTQQLTPKGPKGWGITEINTFE